MIGLQKKQKHSIILPPHLQHSVEEPWDLDAGVRREGLVAGVRGEGLVAGSGSEEFLVLGSDEGSG